MAAIVSRFVIRRAGDLLRVIRRVATKYQDVVDVAADASIPDPATLGDWLHMVIRGYGASSNPPSQLLPQMPPLSFDDRSDLPPKAVAIAVGAAGTVAVVAALWMYLQQKAEVHEAKPTGLAVVTAPSHPTAGVSRFFFFAGAASIVVATERVVAIANHIPPSVLAEMGIKMILYNQRQ